MTVEILGSGQPDGTTLVQSTTELVHLYGGTAVSQAASVASLQVTSATPTSDQINTELVKLNTLIVNLAKLGIMASA